MKIFWTLALTVAMVTTLAACNRNQASSNEQSFAGSSSAVSASSVVESSQVQTGTSGTSSSAPGSAPSVEGTSENPTVSPRKIENGTAVTLTIGNTVIPATLNDSVSAKELIFRLPYTVRLHHYAHDYCGVMSDPLKYDPKDVHYGWLNGDIDFATDANYFTILYEDQAISKVYGYQVNMGKVDGDLSVFKNSLGDDIDVRIALAH